MIVCMVVDRLSITVDAELGKAVREAAASKGMSVSSWVSEAVAHAVRNFRLGQALDVWEAEDGPLTQAELDEADRILTGQTSSQPATR